MALNVFASRLRPILRMQEWVPNFGWNPAWQYADPSMQIKSPFSRSPSIAETGDQELKLSERSEFFRSRLFWEAQGGMEWWIGNGEWWNLGKEDFKRPRLRGTGALSFGSFSLGRQRKWTSRKDRKGNWELGIRSWRQEPKEGYPQPKISTAVIPDPDPVSTNSDCIYVYGCRIKVRHDGSHRFSCFF